MLEADLVERFLESLRLKGRSATTVYQMRRYLIRFTGYLQVNAIDSFFQVTEELLKNYLRTVREKKQSAVLTYKKHHAVYCFYEWLRVSGYILVNHCPVPSCKCGLFLPRYIPSVTQLHHLYEKLRVSTSLYEQRDYALIDLAYSCGLRRKELFLLDIGDICLTDGTIRVQGKGAKERVVPVGKKALANLQHYLYHIRPGLLKNRTTPALFISKRNRRLSIARITTLFQELRKKYRLSPFFVPHSLRHAFATDLMRNGAPLQDISRMLGHAELSTTQIYTRVTIRDLKAHLSAHHPRG